MVNPFDMRGPVFLLFYGILGITVNLLLYFLLRSRERQDYPSHWDYTDPYKLAYLRAGTPEALRVALFSLIDRGLLRAFGDQIVAEAKAAAMVKRPIEQAVVSFFSTPRGVAELFSDTVAGSAGDLYRHDLSKEGLLSGPKTVRDRMPLALFSISLIVGVSLVKLVIAVSRKRYNITFLILLTVSFTIWALSTWHRQRTGAGDEALQQLKYRFHSLKLRAGRLRPGGMTNDASYLAAVFGLSVLPGDYFPYLRTLFPKAVNSGDSFSGGCGSGGCSSSGCGGGGCGGGCGGCGG